jgi:hypothetical protein
VQVSEFLWEAAKRSGVSNKSVCGVPYTALPLATVSNNMTASRCVKMHCNLGEKIEKFKLTQKRPFHVELI